MNDSASHSPRSPWGVIITSLVCAGVVVAGAALEKRFAPASPIRLGLALAEAAATVTVIVAVYRNAMRRDELMHRMMLEGLALAFAATGVIAAAYGHLERAGMPRVDWGLWAWPVMVLLSAIGLLITKFRYR